MPPLDSELLFLCVLVIAINVVSTLSYAVRIAGVRTGRIAFALSLFNLLVLFSRSSNAILAPLLSKRTEMAIQSEATPDPGDFRVLLFAAAVGTLIGAALIPTFQRLITRAVQRFDRRPSMGALILTAANPRANEDMKLLRDLGLMPLEPNPDLEAPAAMNGVPLSPCCDHSCHQEENAAAGCAA